jgi:hypothetical protein
MTTHPYRTVSGGPQEKLRGRSVTAGAWKNKAPTVTDRRYIFRSGFARSGRHEFGLSGAAVADDGEADVGGFGGEEGEDEFFTADTEAVAVESGA